MARGHAQKEAYEAARKEIDDQEKQKEKAQIKKETYEQAKAKIESKLLPGLRPSSIKRYKINSTDCISDSSNILLQDIYPNTRPMIGGVAFLLQHIQAEF